MKYLKVYLIEGFLNKSSILSKRIEEGKKCEQVAMIGDILIDFVS